MIKNDCFDIEIIDFENFKEYNKMYVYLDLLLVVVRGVVEC